MITRRSIFKWLGLGVGSLALGSCKNSERVGVYGEDYLTYNGIDIPLDPNALGLEGWAARNNIYGQGMTVGGLSKDDGYWRISYWQDTDGFIYSTAEKEG